MNYLTSQIVSKESSRDVKLIPELKTGAKCTYQCHTFNKKCHIFETAFKVYVVDTIKDATFYIYFILKMNT